MKNFIRKVAQGIHSIPFQAQKEKGALVVNENIKLCFCIITITIVHYIVIMSALFLGCIVFYDLCKHIL